MAAVEGDELLDYEEETKETPQRMVAKPTARTQAKREAFPLGLVSRLQPPFPQSPWRIASTSDPLTQANVARQRRLPRERRESLVWIGDIPLALAGDAFSCGSCGSCGGSFQRPNGGPHHSILCMDYEVLTVAMTTIGAPVHQTASC